MCYGARKIIFTEDILISLTPHLTKSDRDTIIEMVKKNRYSAYFAVPSLYIKGMIHVLNILKMYDGNWVIGKSFTNYLSSSYEDGKYHGELEYNIGDRFGDVQAFEYSEKHWGETLVPSRALSSTQFLIGNPKIKTNKMFGGAQIVMSLTAFGFWGCSGMHDKDISMIEHDKTKISEFSGGRSNFTEAIVCLNHGCYLGSKKCPFDIDGDETFIKEEAIYCIGSNTEAYYPRQEILDYMIEHKIELAEYFGIDENEVLSEYTKKLG